MLVALKRGAGPMQRQVEDQLRAAIRSGRLVAGERLPSSRVLATDLAVSRGVVSDAYAQLAAEGWLVVAPRSGPRVANLKRDSPSLENFGSAGGRVGASPGSANIKRDSPSLGNGAPVRYDLRPGRPDLSRFPRADWVRSVSAAVRGAGDAELDYPPIAGARRVREVLAAYRGRVRGTLATAEDVLIVLGAAQALVTIAVALDGARIAVENPGHIHIRELLRTQGLEPVPVRVDGEGIVVDELPGDVRAVLVTPAHQFPTGVVMSAARRAELLAWAERHDAVIVEDDYDSEYRYDRAPVGALQGLRPDLVLHIGSVSKTLAPALRLGWLIAPPAWHARLLHARESLDHGLPALEQHAFADFIERGAYDRHIRRSLRTYRRRRDALLEALAITLPDATVSGVAAGLHIVVHVPDAGEEALVAACRERGVVLDGAVQHGARATGATLLISFAAVPDAAADHVAQLIATARARSASSPRA
ncbi:PLP-dependent aminotransferase family protein [Solirubrobacter sp. CPCC 204708]|uniref:PLP-dependent aminotransferase family protein n=1 Tax=Solirubrobacter deserti TaxID=2282478 RepID=A0ABT4RD80_9ACTN|nr:PLP-dependent aminotransferase family protein [Solirubrobacter deserti]MBE2317897.1 PLP-dependent aminotransferase family protein [Solirubrobacter deserti]MDA0136326.1 PLP-dependent aminotransferase family protein [Solirubrobacter deserti]